MGSKGGRPLGSKGKKSIWLLESLAKNGFDYEKMLTGFLEKAAKGNHTALNMAQLLVKMVPYIANMPKTADTMVNIEQLVIARHGDKQALPESIVGAIDTSIEEGHPPLENDHP